MLPLWSMSIVNVDDHAAGGCYDTVARRILGFDSAQEVPSTMKIEIRW